MQNSIDILFVDDQWCTPDGRDIIVGTYGELQKRDPPYVFHYETAQDNTGKYGVRPVLEAIKRIPELRSVVLDIMFGDKANRLGLDILSAIRSEYPILPVFMMTTLDRDNLEVLERAMELGANEFLVKKAPASELENILQIYTRTPSSVADYAIWGNSLAIRRVRADIVRVALGPAAPVLITGASGTGKELVARAIHRQGPRRTSPFVAVHSAALSPSLLESELFGHEQGAFTGATMQRKGRFEMADQGTLFLDEVSEIDPLVQVKLLRVLEQKTFERVGGSRTIVVDIRLTAATNKDLAALVAEDKFRQDLFYRLNGVNIHLPPLRERRDDIRILADLFLKRFRLGEGGGYHADSISASAMSCLTEYDWPGNVRELHNAVERAAIFCRSREIGPEHLPAEIIRKRGAAINPRKTPDEILPEDQSQWARHRILHELQVITEALRQTNGNATVAVKNLFPLVNSPNATYIRRYLRRLQDAPWGCKSDAEIKTLMAAISAMLDKASGR